MINRGFNIALVHSRGGSEFGPQWHDVAKKAGRALVRNDVSAAVKKLRTEKICTPNQTFLHGMSHGALVVASIAMHCPKLANHYLCRVPISHTRHLHKTQLGLAWIEEYGDPRTDDWDAFMRGEDPIEMTVHGTLNETTWFISAYEKDDITPVEHADLLAEKIRQNCGTVTYLRYPSSASHIGAASETIRQEHSAQFWNYLTVKAQQTSP